MRSCNAIIHCVKAQSAPVCDKLVVFGLCIVHSQKLYVIVIAPDKEFSRKASESKIVIYRNPKQKIIKKETNYARH